MLALFQVEKFYQGVGAKLYVDRKAGLASLTITWKRRIVVMQDVAKRDYSLVSEPEKADAWLGREVTVPGGTLGFMEHLFHTLSRDPQAFAGAQP
jgi:hypothetical protein